MIPTQDPHSLVDAMGLFSLLTFAFLLSLPSWVSAVIRITSEELNDGIQSGRFDVVVDVRTREEWEAGHIEGATFMENLNLFGTPNQASTPSDLAGCENCVIAVYCRSGARAQSAAIILEVAGFRAPIYNGLGINQWQEAGFPLVTNVPSVVPACLTTPCPSNVIRITSQELNDGMASGRFDVVIDVRSRVEWNIGHIEGATFMEDLNLFGTVGEASTPSDLAGCEDCVIAVYCNSGNRAQRAAEILADNGFSTPLYNGLGVVQWLAAGFDLVRTPSVTPPCVGNPMACSSTSTTAPSVTPVPDVIRISSQELNGGIQSGRFDVVVDVRRVDEWEAGHIDGATFMENLNLFGTANEASTPSDLAGCEDCVIAVYCRSGARAQTAAQILADNGFRTPIYNGLGVSQWVAAGFPLVTDTPSVVPACVGNPAFCAEDTTTPMPSLAPTRRPFRFCFSAPNTVQVLDAPEPVYMKDVKVGDAVLVGDNHYEPVHGFGHYDAQARGDFVKIYTTPKTPPLELSVDHMVFVSAHHSVPASSLMPGDSIMLGSGETVVVDKIQSSSTTGVYAPFTRSGTIVVNGVLTSTYVAFQESPYLKIGNVETPITWQWLAHSFEAPHRIYCRLAWNRCVEEQVHGVSAWVEGPLFLTQWILRQHWIVSGLCCLVAVVVVGVFYLTEKAMLLPFTGLTLVVLAMLAALRARLLATHKLQTA